MRKRLLAVVAPLTVVLAGFSAVTPASAAGACNSGSRIIVNNTQTKSFSNCTVSGFINSINGPGVIVNSGGTLNLTNVIITGNSATSGSNGGGIYNRGTTTLNSVTITNNTAAHFGGGIFNASTLNLNTVTINGNNADSDGGGIWNSGTVTINGATIGGPTLADANTAVQGGGIFNRGTITDTGLVLQGNSASQVGGGIYNIGSLTLNGARVVGNSAVDGGGLYNFKGNQAGQFAISNSFFSSNHATDAGGAIWQSVPDSSVTSASIDHSTIGDNNTSSQYGGGIELVGPLGLIGPGSLAERRASGAASPHTVIDPFTFIEITDSSIQNNTASTKTGGGIDSFFANLSMARDTVSGNQAGTSGGGMNLEFTVVFGPDSTNHPEAARKGRFGSRQVPSGPAENLTISGNNAANHGGGIYGNPIEADFEHFTIADNHSATGTAGLEVNGTDGSSINIGRTLLARNTPTNCAFTNGSEVTEAPGATDSANLDTGSSCGFTQASDQQNVADPKLGNLADNFGPTQTDALLFGSPAIDAVPDKCPTPNTDERGTTRPQAALCDIGAYECIGTSPTVTQVAPNSGPPAGGTNVVISGTNFDRPATVTFGGTPATNVFVTSPFVIQATSPPGKGVVDVIVQTCRGSSPAGSVDAFTFSVPGLPVAGALPAGVGPAWLWLLLPMLFAGPGLALVRSRRSSRI